MDVLFAFLEIVRDILIWLWSFVIVLVKGMLWMALIIIIIQLIIFVVIYVWMWTIIILHKLGLIRITESNLNKEDGLDKYYESWRIKINNLYLGTWLKKWKKKMESFNDKD